jgi:hypothetical protein
LNSPYKYTDPLGLLPAGWGSSGGCGAEFSSCDSNGSGFQNEFEAQYQQRLDNEWDRGRAQAAANRGDWDTFWDIMRNNDTLSAFDGNGSELRDPNEPQVTVEATLDQMTFIVAYGQPGTGSLNVGTNFQRAAETTQTALESNGHTVYNVGELSSVYGFQNMLDMAAKYKASAIIIYAHGASGAIDIGDGARTDQKDITMNSVNRLVNNGFTGTIFIKACNTGSTSNGIAAALSRRLGVMVEAPTTGMSFSPHPDRLGNSKIHPSTGPTYMVPEGGGTYQRFLLK